MFRHIHFHCTFPKYFNVVSFITLVNSNYLELLDNHFIVWSCEKVQLDKAPCKSTRLCFIIRITQLDPEIGLRGSEGSLNEELPNYQDAIHAGPLLLPPPDYVTINQPQSALILPH
ncbi:hypothetical protein RO3G_13615 [Rhizopus delemar RA 99-880]|uniref:Uncharacterized protein n=1 Tax=Rhizopus delemar (strain RA 99-880 / ATCC MYA-4621 / FGSC 9543 / NRRL 43880) TaxID=246409 RepID=I1CKC4_RHIO9|nr:hypothetical protein RO3G_13615 [Rhizopus delemar RA 99-880]|eukprot:EIE88904.1 hypothetical protein RO3G_13615 [Rhizopus delemar RA 99-880]